MAHSIGLSSALQAMPESDLLELEKRFLQARYNEKRSPVEAWVKAFEAVPCLEEGETPMKSKPGGRVDPGAAKAVERITKVGWIDWCFANWGASSERLNPPAPGYVHLLDYYRANEAEFRQLWVEEWRHQRDEGREEPDGDDGDNSENPGTDQDAELRRTLEELSKPVPFK